MIRKRMDKKGQITIFIILALLILAIIALIFYPSIKKGLNPSLSDMLPNSCIEKEVVKNLNITMYAGGTLNPQLYYRYKNQTLAYLCYTSEWYKTCVMQTPFLKQQIESTTEEQSKEQIAKCISDMKTRIEKRGYEVIISGNQEPKIKIVQDKVVVSLNMSMVVKKGDVPENFPASVFQMEIDSNSYEMIMVASSIQNWEARYGDSTPETYMNFYRNLKVEKHKQSDGTKVYIITDRNTGEKLQFASRSLSWPPGYAFSNTVNSII